ncbi:uncharacterized protein [Argopecten irradians]|uniref:uncharacterized protein isoform X2 n=1 Tax=Argopecten irradians TaxID=31199 RepID=UPI00371C3E0F
MNGRPGRDGLPGLPGKTGERGEDGQKGEKGSPCVCKYDESADAQEQNNNMEPGGTSIGLVVAICLLYVLFIILVVVTAFLYWKMKTTMDGFQKVLKALAERYHINQHGYSDLYRGEMGAHRYGGDREPTVTEEDQSHQLMYDYPEPSDTYIDPAPPVQTQTAQTDC